MEKCGLTFERDIVYANLPHVLYRETAGEWKAREAGEVSPAGR